MIENRNPATNTFATGVIAPLVRLATHVGWCIGYMGSVDGDPDDSQQRAIQSDLNDAHVHINGEMTSILLDLFVGDEGAQLMRMLREDLIAPLPGDRAELMEYLTALADNAAHTGALMELLMTGNHASAGRNL